jgi:hypothetical protein
MVKPARRLIVLWFGACGLRGDDLEALTSRIVLKSEDLPVQWRRHKGFVGL